VRTTELIGLETELSQNSAKPCVGRIVEIASDGAPVIDYQGNELGPLRARTLEVATAAASDVVGREVLLMFESGDVWRPIIVGFVHDTIISPKLEVTIEEPALESQLDFSAKSERMLIEKEEEIFLVCGKSSIRLRSDGKIIIRGTEIVSRASGANKIKGASVNIN
jgi:uncharacterized protein DUF6484